MAGESLFRYAAPPGKIGSADTVLVRSIGLNGEDVETDFLLNSGTVMMAESTVSKLSQADNADALAYLHERLQVSEDYSMPDTENGRGRCDIHDG